MDEIVENLEPVVEDAAQGEKTNANYLAAESDEMGGGNEYKRGAAFWRAIKGFFGANYLYFLAPAIIISVFFGVLAAYQIYPFTNKTMSNYDLLAQICPFLEHFFDVFEGKSSLFYSSAIIGGADVFGTLAYCAISPFTFLFLLVGKGNVYYAISYVLPIKLSCVAIAAIILIKKTFKNVPDYATLALSLLFAYCGYTFVANTYINWVDFLIYMPFVIMGYKKLVESGKIRYFAISYALMIYTCFSIASFALLIVYLVLIAYAFLAVEKERRKAVLTKTCLALVLAVGLALPVMIPAAMAYLKSGRNTGLFENMSKALDAGHLYAKTSYLLSDALTLTLTVVYFFKNGLKRPETTTGLILNRPVLCFIFLILMRGEKKFFQTA